MWIRYSFDQDCPTHIIIKTNFDLQTHQNCGCLSHWMPQMVQPCPMALLFGLFCLCPMKWQKIVLWSGKTERGHAHKFIMWSGGGRKSRNAAGCGCGCKQACTFRWGVHHYCVVVVQICSPLMHHVLSHALPQRSFHALLSPYPLLIAPFRIANNFKRIHIKFICSNF